MHRSSPRLLAIAKQHQSAQSAPLYSPRLQIGIWNIDGGNGLNNDNRQMTLIERLPAIADLFTNVKFDLFAIIGAGPAISSVHDILPAELFTCVASAPSSSGRGGSTFVVAPASSSATLKNTRPGDISEWKAEAIPGAGGAHVRVTHKHRATANKGARNKHTVDLCFVDLEGVDRLALGTLPRHQQQQQNQQQQNRQRLFAVDKELKVARDNPIDINRELLYGENNEIRLSRYLSNVTTNCDIVAGHTRGFRLDSPSMSTPEGKSRSAIVGGASWKDAWELAGSPSSDEFTYEPQKLRYKYYTMGSARGIEDQHDSTAGGEPPRFNAPKRLDRFLLRDGCGLQVSSFKTMQWPCVSRKGEKLLASAFYPVLVSFKLQQRPVTV